MITLTISLLTVFQTWRRLRTRFVQISAYQNLVDIDSPLVGNAKVTNTNANPAPPTYKVELPVTKNT